DLCEQSGLGKWEKDEKGKERWRGLIFHDLRRSAVRNLIRSGGSERVAMNISGHKSRSVFDRYNIVSDADLREATAKIEKGRLDRAENRSRTATNGKANTNIGDHSEPAGASNTQYIQ